MQRIYLVVVLLFLALCANAKEAVLTGIVTHKITQQPIPDANVYFPGTTLGVATNNQGEFKFNKLTPGSYDLTISFSGFKRVKRTVTLKEGENILDFEMIESDLNLGEVVVTGTGTAHHLKTAPVPTELISKKMIESSGATDFTDLMLAVSPSFDFNPGTMGALMKLNGLGNDFILILIDGKRMYGDLGGNSDLSRINPDDIERIEILKGAASLLYGSDAIAGVVNIITKRSKQRVKLTNTTRIRSYATLQQSNSLNLNIGRFSLKSDYNYNSSDGWQLTPYELDDGELVATDAMVQNAYNNYIFTNRLGFRATDKLEFYVGNSIFERDMLNPVTVKKYGYFFDDKTFEGGAKYKLNREDYISFDYNYDKYLYYYKYNQEYSDYVEGDTSLNNDQRMSNFKLKYINSISENHKLTVGVDYLQEKMFSETRLVGGEAEANTLSIYAQDEMTLFDNFELVAGIRAVKHNEFGGAFTPKISALYTLNSFNFRGTYGLGFKAPTVKELYYDYEKSGTVYMGNTDLDPQTSQFYSAAIEFNNSIFTTSLTAYINSVDDLIDYETIDLLPGDDEDGITKRKQHYNVEESSSKGFDLLVNANLGSGFTLGGGYSFVDAKDVTNDIRLEGVAQNYGNVRAAYNHSWQSYNFTANLLGRIQDEKFYDEDEGDAKGYNLWKLTTNHRFTNLGSFIIDASLGVDNIFDYTDDSPYGYNYGTINPGRTLFAGVTINFAK